MNGLRLKVLYLGRCEHGKFELVKTDSDTEQILSPRMAVLIDHPTLGYVLYDTGDADDWQDAYPQPLQQRYPLKEHILLEDKLEECGVKLDDINQIILSHLHFDHAGGLKKFVGKKAEKDVIVSEEEAKAVFFQTIADPAKLGPAHIPSLFHNLKSVTYRTVTGISELAEGITLFVQHCHTPGVVGMIIRLNDGMPMIFCCDTVYTRESYEKELPPGGSINKTDDEFYRQLAVLKKLQQDTGAYMVFGHDFAQTKQLEELGWITSGEQLPV
ncbi:MBL fold metallo-hydrolase [Christensenellaceae bacterium]|nr:MBL fold metallo-hydrolase [Christensenellaceae bacterium]BDF61281.1 MBL fold metallo-hydrolase [Christensenellaceae bacterium]